LGGGDAGGVVEACFGAEGGGLGVCVAGVGTGIVLGAAAEGDVFEGEACWWGEGAWRAGVRMVFVEDG
jgi:hypothetical protein